MNIEQLIENYPNLYHMAASGSWPNIEKHGLQSTQALLDRYGVTGDKRESILAEHRPECVIISHKDYPDASVRDQKPMSDKGLVKALNGSAKVSDWYQLLNSMVFFWLTESRLKTMMSARAYKNIKHDVLTIDTESLVLEHTKNIRLSPMNSGNTKPYPHPRNPGIFYKISDFPFNDRRKTRPIQNTTVELTVLNAVPDIAKHVVDVRNISKDDLNI